MEHYRCLIHQAAINEVRGIDARSVTIPINARINSSTKIGVFKITHNGYSKLIIYKYSGILVPIYAKTSVLIIEKI